MWERVIAPTNLGQVMRRAFVIIGFLTVLMVPTLLQPSAMWLSVRSGDGHLLGCMRVREGESVTLQFTHSMYGGFVRETWRVTPDGVLQREKMVTANPAAAEYYATVIPPERVASGWLVPGEPLIQQALVVRVNQRGRHVLWIGNRPVPLYRLVEDSAQVRISVQSDICAQEDVRS